jgi:hypothetical protein
MATPNFSGSGIFLRDTTLNASSHIDSYHMRNMLHDVKPMDLGPVDIWAMTQKVEMPLYQFSSFGGKNTINVSGIRGEYTWETPISQDLPYIIEDIDPTNTTKGIDGSTFRVKLNRQEFGHSAIFTFDKFNGAEMYVTADPILPIGDGFIYTVRLVNNANTTFLDNKYLANGTKVFRVTSATGEYPGKYDDMTVRSGARQWYNFVGQTDANAHFTVSDRAALMAKNGVSAQGALNVTEIWNIKDKNDPSIATITSLEQLKAKKGGAYMKDAYADGRLSYTFLTAMEAAHISKVALDIETYLMWGKGGRLQRDGADDLRLSTGLWKQLDSAYKYVYNKASFSLDLFRSQLYNFYAGRVDLTGPDSLREIEVQTGMGGMRMVNELIAQEAASAGFLIQAAEKDGIGAIQGQSMNLGFGYAYTKYKIPFLANLTFKINPALDNFNTNDIENPLIDGYPLSSYSFLIFDVTNNTNDNIFLLQKEGDAGALRWRYQNGTMDYLGRNGHQSSGEFSGFRVFMQQAHKSIWVKDPSKILKIVLKNPITGYSL